MSVFYGSQCRTTPSQRPCDFTNCEREECIRGQEARAKSMAAHPSSQGPAVGHDEWQCMHYDDGCRCRCAWCDERNGKPVKAPVTPVEVLCGPDGRWSITGLSEDDLWTLYGALGYVIANASGDMSDDQRFEKIIGSVLPD